MRFDAGQNRRTSRGRVGGCTPVSRAKHFFGQSLIFSGSCELKMKIKIFGIHLDSRGITQDWLTWNDNIRKDIENSGVTWEEALLLMTDRQEWRSSIAQCARHDMD